jgi:hypothetical protein
MRKNIDKSIDQSKAEQNGDPPRGNENFCQQASQRYLNLLDEANDDPRVAAGQQALNDLERTGGWAPVLDSRDARISVKEN